MNWHQRLTQAREAKELKKSAFARLVGVSAPTVTDWENGETKMIDGTNLVNVCSVLEITPEWLIHGSDSPMHLPPGASRIEVSDEAGPNQYAIPMVELKLQAGVTGFQTEADGLDGGETILSKSWVDRKGFDPRQLISMHVKGESMEPTFYAGDVVVINLADKKLVDNAVYAFNYDGEAVIKRLSRDAGKWWLLSDNADQRRFYRRQCSTNECIIIGKVVRRESDRF